MGPNSIDRKVPVSLKVDGSLNLIGCNTTVYGSSIWKQSPLGIYYSPSPAGRVGFGTFSPNYTLDIGQDGGNANSVAVNGNFLVLGSTTVGKMSFFYGGPGPEILLNAEPGNSFLFSANPAYNPVIFADTTIAVNYSSGFETPGRHTASAKFTQSG